MQSNVSTGAAGSERQSSDHQLARSGSGRGGSNEDLIAGRRMQAAAADRVGIESGCEPAGLARRAPRSGVGVGGLLSLRRCAL